MADNNNPFGNQENGGGPKMPGGSNKVPRFSLSWMYIAIAVAALALFFFNGQEGVTKRVGYSDFKEYVNKGYIKNVIGYDDNTVQAEIKTEHVSDVFDNKDQKGAAYVLTEAPSREMLAEYLDDAQNREVFTGDVDYDKRQDYWGPLMSVAFPILLIVLMTWFMMRRMGGGSGGGGVGGGIFNVGKSKAKLFDKNTQVNVNFKDVAGLAEAKQEVEEIVEFLKAPQKYTELGGKIPKGALLVGPPGTGKTLLAKAVAGEANVPFFSLAGSDFVEMFVGVGASRVRDLFKQAQEKAPCIIFIDEIDAVGRERGKNNITNGNDERENTLNQLLTEMDGFGNNSGIIILAATNRVEILDKALLRAGRFDRQIHVNLPDLNERKEVFDVHLKPLKVSEEVDKELLCRQTPGFSGADIANVCNEAALIAARHNKKVVDMQDFHDAIDRIVGGLEKKTKITTESERHSIAIHESGHASLSWVLEHANPLIKVTIVPRGQALGAAWYLPEERQITTKEQMLDQMCATLGGRAAEEVFLGRISSGAMNDLERVTQQAYGMVAYLGMSDELPNVSYYNNNPSTFTKPYSEKTAESIDKEVQRIINDQYQRAKDLLIEYKDKHHELAQLLIDEEVILAADVEKIFGKRPWKSRSEEILQQEEKKNVEEEEAKQEPETEPMTNESEEPTATPETESAADSKE